MSLKEAVGKSGYFIRFYNDFCLHRNSFLLILCKKCFVYIVLGILDEVIKPLRESKKWKVCWFYSFVLNKSLLLFTDTDFVGEFYHGIFQT